MYRVSRFDQVRHVLIKITIWLKITQPHQPSPISLYSGLLSPQSPHCEKKNKIKVW